VVTATYHSYQDFGGKIISFPHDRQVTVSWVWKLEKLRISKNIEEFCEKLQAVFKKHQNVFKRLQAVFGKTSKCFLV